MNHYLVDAFTIVGMLTVAAFVFEAVVFLVLSILVSIFER